MPQVPLRYTRGYSWCRLAEAGASPNRNASRKAMVTKPTKTRIDQKKNRVQIVTRTDRRWCSTAPEGKKWLMCEVL
jgi:hypothetical protein